MVCVRGAGGGHWGKRGRDATGRSPPSLQYLYLVSVEQQPDEQWVRPAPLLDRADKVLYSCSQARLARRLEDEDKIKAHAGPAERVKA